MEDFSDLEDYVNVVRSKIQTMLEKLEEAKNLNQELGQVIRFIYLYLAVLSKAPDNDVYVPKVPKQKNGYRIYSRISRPAYKPTTSLGWTIKV